jgi:hypothetical protein
MFAEPACPPQAGVRRERQSGSAARNLLFPLPPQRHKLNPNNRPHRLTIPCLPPPPNSLSRSWPVITRPGLIARVLCILVRPASPLGNNPRNPSPRPEANPSNPNPFYFSPQCRTARQQDSTRPPNASRSASRSRDATRWPRARSNRQFTEPEASHSQTRSTQGPLRRPLRPQRPPPRRRQTRLESTLTRPPRNC